MKQYPYLSIPDGTLCLDYHMGCLTNLKFCSNHTGPWGRRYIFGFNIVKVGSYYEVDLVLLPDFEGRDTSCYIIHTLPSARGGKKICVNAGREPRTEKAAKDLAMNWSDLIAKYIITGKTPDEQINEYHRR